MGMAACSLFKKEPPPPPPPVPVVQPAPPPPPVPKPDPALRELAAPPVTGGVLVHSWITSGDQRLLLTPGPLAQFAAASSVEAPYAGSRLGPSSFTPDPAGTIIIDLDSAQQFQSMLGFGLTISDTAAWLLRERMTAEQRAALLGELYGPQSALKLSLARISVGASDFSLEHGSLSETPADPALSAFSIEAQRSQLLPVLKQVQALEPNLHLLAVPYSAQAWMKTEDSLYKGSLKPEAYGAYARYLKRYLDIYREEGLALYALSVQNEPLRQQADYPTMFFEPTARAKFISTQLGPLLTVAYPELRIIDGEQSWDDSAGVQDVLAEPGASPYVRGIAWHCYAGEVGAQSTVHAAAPRDVYLSDCSGGRWAPGWGDGLLHFARTAVVGSTRHWARGVMLGNLVLDEEGGPHLGGCRNCRGLVTLHAETGELTRNVEYFALAHASRFVLPGARRIASGSRSPVLEHVAFLNPDRSIVLLVVNPAPQPTSFLVRMNGMGFRTELPAASVATYRWGGN